jgi:hypothetical protein
LMKSDPNEIDSLSNMAQRITEELASYPKRITAQFVPNLHEISDQARNTNNVRKTKIVDFFVLESIQLN